MAKEAQLCACGRPLPPPRPVGRRRKRCEVCAADGGALGKAWRHAHPERVDSYNAERRTKSKRARRIALLNEILSLEVA
jgi:hypothetical protein